MINTILIAFIWIELNVFCGLKGRRPFWLLNPRLGGGGGVPSLFLLLISLSGDELNWMYAQEMANPVLNYLII